MNKPIHKTTQTGIKRLINAISFSRKGLMAAYTNEEAFRQECWGLLLMLPLALWLGHSNIERALLISSYLLIMIIELLNSAIETIVDRISTEYHPLSGQAKDIGSAAVLVAVLLCCVVWLLILI